MPTIPLLVVMSTLALASCAHLESAQTDFVPAYPDRNVVGDPIVAVFEGRIPCADGDGCDMRKVSLVLYGRDRGQVPTTYWLGQVQVGLSDDRRVHTGTWTIQVGVSGYPNGVVYTLDSTADPSLRWFWRVNDDIALVLDSTGRPKAGNAAWGYMLSRDCAPYGPRSYGVDRRTRSWVSEGSSNCASSAMPKE
jgi:hypothetical protein